MTEKFYPYPEAVRDAVFTITAGEGAVSGSSVWAPTGDSQAEFEARTKVTARVKWTPEAREIEGVPIQMSDLVEGARIERLLKGAGMGTEIPTLGDPVKQAFFEQEFGSDRMKASALYASTVGTPDELMMRDFAVRNLGAGGEKFVRNLVNGHAPSAADYDSFTGSISRTLMKAFAPPPDLGMGDLTDGDLDGMGESMVPGAGEWMEQDDLNPQWGKLKIVRMPLSVLLPREKDGIRRLNMDYGTKLGRIDRVFSDGKIFKRKVYKGKGGAMLVDQSGSMSISDRDVAAVLDKYPLMTVATYSGCGKKGELRIVAYRGKRTKNLRAYSGGNVVDGPALKWLAGQRGPRIWICDGHVTGINDCGHKDLTIEAKRIERGAAIKRYSNFEEYLRTMKGR